MADMTDEEVVRQAFEKWYGVSDNLTIYRAWIAALSALPGGLPAAAALLSGEAVAVPKSPTEEMAAAFYKVKPRGYAFADNYWRDFLAASPYKDKPPSFGSDRACLICGQNHHNLPCPQTRVT